MQSPQNLKYTSLLGDLPSTCEDHIIGSLAGGSRVEGGVRRALVGGNTQIFFCTN